MDDRELLALHRRMVETPSLSGSEAALCGLLADVLAARGVEVRRAGNSLLAVGQGRAGPVVALNSHLDTVPASSAWTRAPYRATCEDGRVYGLGSNDAKAPAAAMIAAFLRLQRAPVRARVVLMLAEREETDGAGSLALARAAREAGLDPDAVVVGEPTGLDLCVAQMGRVVIEVIERAEPCHVAHRRALQRENPIRALVQDLEAIAALDLGPEDPVAGPAVIEPTMLRGGTAANVIPGEVSCVVDLRFGRGCAPDDVVRRIREAASGSVRLVEAPLAACWIATDHPLVQAARRVRPEARLYGSAGLSDWTAFPHGAGLKVGPGLSTRSHTADEFVLESEILDGARFYEALVREYAGGDHSGA